jgi:hypothetical protein
MALSKSPAFRSSPSTITRRLIAPRETVRFAPPGQLDSAALSMGEIERPDRQFTPRLGAALMALQRDQLFRRDRKMSIRLAAPDINASRATVLNLQA